MGKHYGDPTFYQWGVENKRSGVLMGTISLFPAPELKTGWHLNTEILALPGRRATRWAASGGTTAI